MAGAVTFDDTFVQQQLTQAATRGLALDPAGGSASVASIDRRIGRCVRLLGRHHGLRDDLRQPTPSFLREQACLTLGLGILGHRLGLKGAAAMMEHTIAADWLAHTELAKAKRYRDHITHPVRVTAIGWWFLHREGEHLLNVLADHYEKVTDAYRTERGFGLGPHDWRAVVEFAWLAAGLLHDSAYAFEYHLRCPCHIPRSLLSVLDVLPRARAAFVPGQGIGAKLKRLDSTWLGMQGLGLRRRVADVCADQFRHAHALLGGLHHCLALTSRRHSLPGLVVQLAARAIITHHDGGDAQIVSDPLATLLFVSDGLQAWERPFLHAEPPAWNSDRRVFRPIVECRRVHLKPSSGGYRAVYEMNETEESTLRNPPYCWCFDRFQEPNRRLEGVVREQGMLPRLTCSWRNCIRPMSFLKP